ncbi:MAG TPA: PP2C family protein-serine/threonine phosphatase [Acidimicrobiales bacterium]
MLHHPVLLAVAAACMVAAYVWGRSTRRLQRACSRIQRDVMAGKASSEALVLARSTFRKELHTTVLYGLLAAMTTIAAFLADRFLELPALLILVPVAISLRYARSFMTAARLAEERSIIERRAEEVLAQEELAPLRWAARLAPEDLPQIDGFEVGRVYEPGTGAMAGDFYDVHPTGGQRLAAVIGDVTGHGIEPSITAFQVKYLLRVFLRQYRDPGQAVEELNQVLSASGRADELVSLAVVVFDQVAGTLRYASAGHPPAWLWHDGAVRPLRSTGPLLTLDPHGSFTSREVGLEVGDVLLMYTDGLTEARSGEQLFGEDRVAAILRRDPGEDVEVLCKTLLEAARDFASEPLGDDVAILAIRRT